MLWRALLAFLALPGVVAGLVPPWIVSGDRWRGHGWAGAWSVVAIGVAALLWCVRDFFVAGQGTLAPWDPPKHLVGVGLYRFTRNPMYVAIVTLICGWSVAAGSPLLGCYAVVLAGAFHARVILYEEPRLKRSFPEAWNVYSASVPRWLIRLPRRKQT